MTFYVRKRGFGGIRDRFDLVMPPARLGDGGVFDHFRLK
jgi:hypothetical protein